MDTTGLFFFFLPFGVNLIHLLGSPYTKVEESFSLQATHDILRYGLPTNNVSSAFAANYDHITFPGAVPRSFVGPLVLAQASAPFGKLLGSYMNEQVIVRGALGLLTSISLIYYTHRVRRAYGPTVAHFYTLFQLSQFHLPYYASRTLPNTFALLVSIIAHACFLPEPTWSPKAQRNGLKLGLYLLTIAAVVFRSEVALLLGFQALHILFTRRLSLIQAITAGIAGGIIGLVATIGVDSYFWQSYSETPIFSTLFLTENFGLIWPEFSAFYFNAIQGQASEWGESSWHYYFTNAIPKLLLNPIWLLTIPVAVFSSWRVAVGLALPEISFTAFYSLLAHKEWRFIMYIVPQLTLLSSIGAAWIWNRREKSPIYTLLSLGVFASIPASFVVSTGMLAISALNYPGGDAVSRLHTYLPTDMAVKIHLDVPTCMTGATRFLQEAPLWNSASPTQGNNVVWDKTENEAALLSPEFWLDVDFAVMNQPTKAIGAYKVLEIVSGFRRVRVYKPGEKVSVAPISVAEEVMSKEGLRGDDGYEDVRESVLRRLVKRARLDGFGARDVVLRGWWIGVEMEKTLWILKRQENPQYRQEVV